MPSVVSHSRNVFIKMCVLQKKFINLVISLCFLWNSFRGRYQKLKARLKGDQSGTWPGYHRKWLVPTLLLLWHQCVHFSQSSTPRWGAWLLPRRWWRLWPRPYTPGPAGERCPCRTWVVQADRIISMWTALKPKRKLNISSVSLVNYLPVQMFTLVQQTV